MMEESQKKSVQRTRSTQSASLGPYREPDRAVAPVAAGPGPQPPVPDTGHRTPVPVPVPDTGDAAPPRPVAPVDTRQPAAAAEIPCVFSNCKLERILF